MLGTLYIPVSDQRTVAISGGPFRKRPAGYVGVKLAAEINAPCDISIPTVDYNVPNVRDLSTGLNRTVTALLQGKDVYAGCMGGMGRTGLFLAVLCKAFGIENPVEYVRENYYPHAVETPEQYQYVLDFQIPLYTRLRIKLARIASRLGFNNDQTPDGFNF